MENGITILGGTLICVLLLWCGMVWPRTISVRSYGSSKQTWPQIASVAVMSVLSPLLAACIQTAYVCAFLSGRDADSAMIERVISPGLWICEAIEAVATFLIVLFFMKIALR